MNKIKLVADKTLGNSTYHYYRSIIKNLMRVNGVLSTKFVRTEGYNGVVMIAACEKAKAKLVLKEQDSVLVW